MEIAGRTYKPDANVADLKIEVIALNLSLEDLRARHLTLLKTLRGAAGTGYEYNQYDKMLKQMEEGQ